MVLEFKKNGFDLYIIINSKLKVVKTKPATMTCTLKIIKSYLKLRVFIKLGCGVFY